MVVGLYSVFSCCLHILVGFLLAYGSEVVFDPLVSCFLFFWYLHLLTLFFSEIGSLFI